ncbi:MAG: restriction endonuclease subunit R, partial [Gammaproteobacteria bacterium]
KMLADYFEQSEEKSVNRVEEFEKEVKQKFIDEPGQMRLLIVVDKLLTGFDAPSATYLYIDKQMQDHSLFQAICRVNRLDGDDKEYGYIIDYKDLFKQLEGTINDYTAGALEGYDADDVAGLLTDRLEKAKERLELARETVKALCEPVMEPRDSLDYLHYFCAKDSSDKNELANNEPLRMTLYQVVSALIRAYSNLANEMLDAGYSEAECVLIKNEVAHFEKVRDEVKLASGDLLDMKRYEPAMRHLLDMYIRAEESTPLIDFDEMGLIELVVEKGDAALDALPEGIKKNPESMAETIENNMRKTIIDENPVNPKYYEKMSELLDALIVERRKQAISYQEYLKRIKALAKQVIKPESDNPNAYPESIDSLAKRALYDNLESNESLAVKIDTAIRYTKKEDWVGDRFKEREVANAIRNESAGYDVDVAEVLELAKNQREYQ